MGRTLGAGDLREYVTLRTATATRDAYGVETIVWTDSATVAARVTERGGREPLLADRPVMVVSYEVVIRAGLAVSHADRLVWRGLTLQIETVTPLPVGFQTLRCLAIEP